MRVGALAGLVGGVTIWLYELLVRVYLLHLWSVRGLFENSAVLAFGEHARGWPSPWALIAATVLHFATAIFWGATFAVIWPALRKRAIEATLAALIYGMLVWIIMHWVVLAALSPAPLTYTTYSVLDGLVSHTFTFSVPVALIVKRMLR